MASNPAIQLAETIQTASINRAPSPTHDINPSTAASIKIPVETSSSNPISQDPSLSQYGYPSSEGEIEIEIDDDLDDDDIPVEALRPIPRRRSFGPLPDLRFEQSYLASIAGAETKWRIAFITIRDQVLLPLLQGTVWSLALFGWRHWNRSAQLSGNTVGAKVRRWWYRTNNWKLPAAAKLKLKDPKLAKDVSDVSFASWWEDAGLEDAGMYFWNPLR